MGARSPRWPRRTPRRLARRRSTGSCRRRAASGRGSTSGRRGAALQGGGPAPRSAGAIAWPAPVRPSSLVFVSLDDDERQLDAFLAQQPQGGLRSTLWLPDGHARAEWMKSLRMDSSGAARAGPRRPGRARALLHRGGGRGRGLCGDRGPRSVRALSASRRRRSARGDRRRDHAGRTRLLVSPKARSRGARRRSGCARAREGSRRSCAPRSARRRGCPRTRPIRGARRTEPGIPACGTGRRSSFSSSLSFGQVQADDVRLLAEVDPEDLLARLAMGPHDGVGDDRIVVARLRGAPRGSRA